MAKTVVIHQPDFLPYVGFFHRLLHADLFVILDTVQYARGSSSWQRRDKIKTAQGEAWISIDARRSARDAALNTILLSQDSGWRARHMNMLRHNYASAPYYREIIPHVEELYSYVFERMMDFNLASIHMLMRLFEIEIAEILASVLHPTGKSNELLVDILAKVEATTYLSGIGAKDYYKPESFDKAGIAVTWQNFVHPVYPQLHGAFIPYLSSIDLLFNCGTERSRAILRKECDGA